MVYRPLGDFKSRWNKKFQKVPVRGSAIPENCQLEEVPIGGSLPSKTLPLGRTIFSNFVDGKNLTLFSALNDLTIWPYINFMKIKIHHPLRINDIFTGWKQSSLLWKLLPLNFRFWKNVLWTQNPPMTLPRESVFFNIIHIIKII